MALPRAKTLPALLLEMMERQPSQHFLICGSWRLTYSEFFYTSQRIAAGLARLGVKPGTKVGILMGNRAEWLLSFAAITMLGGVMVGLNTWWRRREIQHALQLADVEVLIMVDRFLSNDYLNELASIDLAHAAPMLRTLVHLGSAMSPTGVPFCQLMQADAVAPPLQSQPIDPDSLACLLFTSGSTGRSKAAGLTHRGLIENCYGIGERMHFTSADRLLLVTPLFFSFGCANGLFAILTHGGSIVLAPKYDAGELLRLVEEERCTAVYAPVNAALALPDHQDFASRDLSSWRTGICPNNVLPTFEQMGVPEMITAYGLTECYGNSSNADCKWPLEKRLAGMGTPIEGVQIEIVDPTHRSPLPCGQEGEIRIRGYVTPGYYKDPAQTAKIIDADGWLYTGDLGSIDADGVVHFRGRLGEMIKTNGINVTPLEVEESLQEHGAVKVAVVCGLEDRDRGEIVSALVVLNDGAQGSAEELIAHCRNLMASFKIPRFIQVISASEMPMTDTGKISRRLAKTMLTERYAALSSVEVTP